MSAFVVVDTHRFVKNLSRNGFTERQAEAPAEEQVRLLTTHLATEADLAATRADIEQSLVEIEGAIDEFGVEMAGRIEAFKADLLKWWIGALTAQAVVIVTLVRLLL